MPALPFSLPLTAAYLRWKCRSVKLSFSHKAKKKERESEKKLRIMHKSPVFHFGWPACPSIRPLVWHILGVIIVSLSGISGWPQRQATQRVPKQFGSPPSYAFSYVPHISPTLFLSLCLWFSHSARFSYNNILIPLIHATLAAKPNKLKAAARARRLRGCWMLPAECCCCCWTLLLLGAHTF